MNGKPVFAYTSKGPIQGLQCSYNGGENKYYRFTKVRYAQIPVGDLRFADPEEIATFEGLNSNECDDTKKDTKGKNMENTKRNNKEGTDRKNQEDCLFVDIHTPELRPGKSDNNYTRPVIVFVPSALPEKFEVSYGGEFLMAEDVVLVVLFHRRDIFGFTGFQKPNNELNIHGDAGLKDIIKGFEFVKKEIRHFGGCPGNITAYGQGLSCAYIRWLTVEPYSGKYFHKMILSSSMEHSIKRTLQRCQYDIRQVAEKIGPDEEFDSDKACLEYLREVPVEELMSCSDPMFGAESRRVARKNNLLAVQGDIYKVQMPVLIGFNAKEALIEMALAHAKPRPQHLGKLMWLTQTQSTEEEAVKAALEAVKFYLDHTIKFSYLNDSYPEMIETDISYIIGTLNLASSLTQEMDPENVYLYKFSVELALNYTKKCFEDASSYRGAGHGDELAYIFKKDDQSVQKNSAEEKVIKLMTGIWARFARTGNPNPVNGSKPTWQPVGQRPTHYFEIDSKRAAYGAFSYLDQYRFLFWDQIYGMNWLSEFGENENVEDKIDKCSLGSNVSRVPTYSYTILPKEQSRGRIFAHTSKGSVEGDISNYNGNDYYSFQHVPYAKVPIGDLRFAAPKDISSFEDLKKFKLDENGRYGPEDHLFLHIYTREVTRKKSPKKYTRPVIVFVPGRLSPRAEQYRSEDLYGPQFLLQEDVVLVVLSYRRDILGFTAFEKPNAELDVPIDAGVQDIIKAFCFVKNEIQFFGGCPDNVTAYGQGTGATYVRMIAAQNAKNDLFHKMILSSSMEPATGNVLPVNRYEIRSLVRIILGRTIEDDSFCIKVLRKLPVEEHLKFDSSLLNSLRGIAEGIRVFRPRHLHALSTAPSYGTPMPVLIGYNSLEGLVDRVTREGYDELFQVYLIWSSIRLAQLAHAPETVKCPKTDDEWGKMVWKIINMAIKSYKSLVAITEGANKDSRQEIVEMILSDLNYITGTVALATHFVKTMAQKNVYLYRFGVNLDFNFTARLYDNVSFSNDAAHADELGYIFKTPVTTAVTGNSSSDQVIKRMTKLWVQFARTGDPNPVRRNELLDVNWRPIGKNLTHCLHINNSNVSYDKIPQLEMERFKFWETLVKVNFFSGPLRMLESGNGAKPTGRKQTTSRK